MWVTWIISSIYSLSTFKSYHYLILCPHPRGLIVSIIFHNLSFVKRFMCPCHLIHCILIKDVSRISSPVPNLVSYSTLSICLPPKNPSSNLYHNFISDFHIFTLCYTCFPSCPFSSNTIELICRVIFVFWNYIFSFLVSKVSCIFYYFTNYLPGFPYDSQTSSKWYAFIKNDCATFSSFLLVLTEII